MNTPTDARAADMALGQMIAQLESEIRGNRNRADFLNSKRAELRESMSTGIPSWAVMGTIDEVKKAVDEKRPVQFNFDQSFNGR